jgi:hypothetical protein
MAPGPGVVRAPGAAISEAQKAKAAKSLPMTRLFSSIFSIFHLNDDHFDPRAILLLEH